MDHLINNGTTSKILYINNLENSLLSNSIAYLFTNVH